MIINGPCNDLDLFCYMIDVKQSNGMIFGESLYFRISNSNVIGLGNFAD